MTKLVDYHMFTIKMYRCLIPFFVTIQV
jgi:hypothetical protein